MINNILFFLITSALFFFSVGHLTSPAFLRYFNVLLILPMLFFSFKEPYVLKRNKSTIFLIAFTAIAFISLVLNFEILEVPKKSFENLRYYLLGFMGIAPLKFWLSRANVKTKKTLTSLYFVSIIVSCLRALYLYLQHGKRTGGYLHIMTYGYGLAMIIPILIALILYRKKLGEWFDSKLCLISIPFAFLGLALTQARGAILGLAFGFPLLTKSLFPRLTKAYLIIVGLAVAFVSFNYFFPQDIGIKSRMLMSYNNGSDSLRRTLWQSAWIATKERPILGWGLQNQYTQLERILKENNLTTHGEEFTHSHNFLLETASGTGFIGLFLFLGWLIFWIKEIFKTQNKILQFSLLPFLAVMIVSGQFEFFLTETNGRMIFLVYAFSQALMTTDSSREIKNDI